MKIQKHIRKSGIAIFLLASVFLIHSCKKADEQIAEESSATVIVNLGLELNNEEITPSVGEKSARLGSGSSSENRNGKSVLYAEEIQEITVPFSNDLSIVATLVPERPTTESATTVSRELMASKGAPSTHGPALAATPVQKPLDAGVKYRVIVYNSDGTQNSNSVYTYGSTPPELLLNSGNTYTFVIYSINSTDPTVPDVTGSTLSTATVNAVSGDLMYFKKDLAVNFGNNYLDAILKHQFSQITTNISLNARVIGNVTNIGTTTISPRRPSASLKFSTDVLTYASASSTGTTVVFPTIVPAGVRNITATPTLLIAPETTTGNINIASLTIGGVTKTDIALNNVKITPGLRYNLNIQLQGPCTEDIDPTTFGWSYPNEAAAEEAGGVNQSFTAPAADYGYEFDITEMDNSFNLNINGTALISKDGANPEVQFQAGVTNFPVNIRFASDGGLYGAGGIPQVYSLSTTGTQQPVIRVVISATGEVFMYGKRSNGGALEPLELFGGYVFNTVTWNTTGVNVVNASQQVTGVTTLRGSGKGRKIIACP